MYKIITITAALLLSFASNSQNITIGQDAQDVKAIVEWTTNKNQKENRFKKGNISDWTWESKYDNGEIREIIQCYLNQYLIDFQIKADYCEHFVMQNKKLHHTLKEFKNITLNQVKQYYIANGYAKHKVDDLYFTDDFQSYYKFYLNGDKLATVEMQKVILSDFSKVIQTKIKSTKEISENIKSDDAIKNLLEEPVDKNTAQIAQMKTDLEKDKDLSEDKTINQKNVSAEDVQKLLKRKILSKSSPTYSCNESGIVIVQVFVNRLGKVITAKPYKIGTTTNSQCLFEAAKIAALNTAWEAKSDAADVEVGTISYNFKISN